MEYKLSELFELQMGKTPSRDNPEYWDSPDYPWISIGDLSNSGKYICETKEGISEQAKSETGIKAIPANTVIMSFKLSIGKVAITSRAMYSNEAIMAFVDKGVTEIIPNYLYYLLMSKEWDEGTNAAVMGKTLNKATLSDTVINIHQVNEQQHIVACLDNATSIIDFYKQQLTKLDELVKARFIEMFGEPIVNPMKWEVKPLKEISNLITNGTTPKGGSENYVSSGIVFLRSQNVWRNRVELDDVVYIDEETHDRMKKSSLHHKDILITKTGRINTENSSLGRAALYLGEDDQANINGHVYLVRLDGTVVPEYVITILTGEAYRRYIRKVCVGGIDKRQINIDHVEDFPIILAPYKLQEEFTTFIAHVGKSKAVVQSALDKAQLLFDCLMQKYFG